MNLLIIQHSSKSTRRALTEYLGGKKIRTTCNHCGKKHTKDYAKSRKIAERNISDSFLERAVRYWNINGGVIIKCTCKGTPHTNTRAGINDCYCGWKRPKDEIKEEARMHK